MKRHSCYYCHDYVYGFEPHRILFIVDEFQAGEWPVHNKCIEENREHENSSWFISNKS